MDLETGIMLIRSGDSLFKIWLVVLNSYYAPDKGDIYESLTPINSFI